MKLDRNINPNGICKYALILVRKLNEVTQAQLLRREGKHLTAVEVEGEAIDTGKEKPFFVLRLQDRFAAPALRAYAKAVREYAEDKPIDARVELREYAREVANLANEADGLRDHSRSKLPD